MLGGGDLDGVRRIFPADLDYLPDDDKTRTFFKLFLKPKISSWISIDLLHTPL
jgi:hypothetical protein